MLDHQAMQSDFQKIKTTKKHLQQLQCFCKGSLRSCWLCGRTTCPQFWKMANHQLSPAFSRLVGLWDSGFPLVRFFPCWYEPKIHNTEAIYPEDGYDIISCFCILVCFFFWPWRVDDRQAICYFSCVPNTCTRQLGKTIEETPTYIWPKGPKMIYGFDRIWWNSFGWY